MGLKVWWVQVAKTMGSYDCSVDFKKSGVPLTGGSRLNDSVRGLIRGWHENLSWGELRKGNVSPGLCRVLNAPMRALQGEARICGT